MKRKVGSIALLGLLAAVGCSSGGGEGDGPSANACYQACDKLESCSPGSVCTVNGEDCSGTAREIADCINSSPCDQTNQCLLGGSGGSSGSGGSGSGGTGGTSTGGCADIAGSWNVTGNCGVDNCVITQSGCSVNFECDDGAASYAGSVTGTSVSFVGVTGTCQGTISGNQIAGTCTGGGVVCAYTASR